MRSSTYALEERDAVRLQLERSLTAGPAHVVVPTISAEMKARCAVGVVEQHDELTVSGIAETDCLEPGRKLEQIEAQLGAEVTVQIVERSLGGRAADVDRVSRTGSVCGDGRRARIRAVDVGGEDLNASDLELLIPSAELAADGSAVDTDSAVGAHALVIADTQPA